MFIFTSRRIYLNFFNKKSKDKKDRKDEPGRGKTELGNKNVELWDPETIPVTDDMIISEEQFNPIFGELLEKEPVSVERLTQLVADQLGAIAKEEMKSNPKKAVENFDKRSAELLDQLQGSLSQNDRWAATAKGLRFASLIPAWRAAHSKEKTLIGLMDWNVKEYAENVRTMLALEETHPGSSTELHRQFNISTFGRYPVELLRKQFEEKDLDIPYGVVMYPNGDSNGGFYRQKAVNSLSTLDKSLQGKKTIRIIELNNTAGIPLSLIGLHSKYGNKPEGNKLSFAIIGGHGTPDSVEIGDEATPEKLRKLTSKDLDSPGVEVVGNFFEKGASIVLISCSTGQDFVPKLFKKTGLTAIGPESPAGLKSLEAITLKNGETHIRPEFYNPDTNSHVKTKTLISKSRE